MFASTSFSSKTVSGLNNANLNFLNVYNDANFYGTTTFYGPVNITVPVGFVNLTVTNQTTLNKLTVSGATIFNGPVTFNGTITLTDLTLNNLTVNGTSTLKGNVAIGTSIAPVNTDTFGPVELTGTLLQTGVSTFVGRVNVSVLLSTLTALAVTTGQTTLQDTFITNLVVSVSADFSGPFRSHGYVILYDTLTVIGLINGTNQELTGTLTVTGLTTLNGGLDLTGALVLTGDLSITGFLTVAGITTLGVLNSGVTNTGALTVTGAVVITGLVGITGNTVITGNLTTTGIFTSSGASIINGTISLNGIVTLVGAVVAPGGISMTATTLAITLSALLGSIFLTTNFAGASINLNSFSTVNVTGSGFIVGTLGSPVSTTLNGNTTITIGTFFVGSATTPVGQLWYGTVTHGDPTHLYNFNVYGLANLTTLTVFSTSVFTGLATFNGGVTITGTLTLGALTVTSLTVNTTSTFTGLATFNGGVTITGTITLGALTVTSLVVNTTSTFTGLATFNNIACLFNSSFGGLATYTAGVLVSGGTLVIGSTVSPISSNMFGPVTIGALTAASSLDVYGPTNLKNGTGGLGSLSVASTISVSGTALLNGNSVLQGAVTSNNGITITAGGLTVTAGGVTVNGGGIGVTSGPATFLGTTFNVASGATPASITMYGSAIGGILLSSAGTITLTGVGGNTVNGTTTFTGAITAPTINGNTTVNGTLTIGPGGATHDLAVYGTAFLGTISQAGTAGLDAVNANSYRLGGVLQFDTGTYTPAFIATAGISFSVSFAVGQYSTAGSVTTLSINLVATYTGTSAAVVQFSLPGSAPARNSFPLVQASSGLGTFPTTINLVSIAAGINVASFTTTYSVSGDTIQVLSTFSYLR